MRGMMNTHGRTIIETSMLDAIAEATEEALPAVTEFVVGPIRPISYDEAMDTRFGCLRVRGYDLTVNVDYEAMRVVVAPLKPLSTKVTRAGRASWGTLLADGQSVPVFAFPLTPVTYVRPGYTLTLEDIRIIG